MRILLVEDDEVLCRGVCYHLEQAGYLVDTCADGEDGLYLASQSIYDLVILDRLLPSMNGIDVLHKLRQKNVYVPVLLMTALSEVHDKIVGLDAGADDYLTKPFDILELLARVRALCRRPTHIELTTTLTYKDICLDLEHYTLTGPNATCTLSQKEFLLAELFIRSPKTILSRNLLLSKIWGPDRDVEDTNIENFIHFLRRHLTHTGSSLKIQTTRGVGYSLEDTNA